MGFRSTCLSWIPGRSDFGPGIIVSGSKLGSLFLYNAQLLFDSITCINEMNHNELPLIIPTDKQFSDYLYTFRENVHIGTVRSLDFNKFQVSFIVYCISFVLIIIFNENFIIIF